jgi:hypothetical protein
LGRIRKASGLNQGQIISADGMLYLYEERTGHVALAKPNPAKLEIISEFQVIKGEGKDFRILVEITLSFTSRTRLTRKGSHSYLANWIEWQSSKYNESFNSFRNRTIDYIEADQSVENTTEDVADVDKTDH